ncbi:MAG: DUF2254 family protein [Dehalococcoidia bacterium]|nr:DUF2254 family protein [Dehalococcoidia bacterium]
MKADWKTRLLRREAEDWGAIFLLVALAVGMALVTLGGRCLACGLGDPEASGLLSTLAQSLSAIFAIAFSLTLVAVQLATAAYTPRVLPLHTWHPYFVGLFVIYLGTIGYLFLLAGGHAFLGPSAGAWRNVGLVLSLFALGYLAPFTAHTVRFLLPAQVLDVLITRLSPPDFRSQPGPRDKLQPVEDIIVKAMQADDHQTAREGLWLLAERYRQLSRTFDPRSDRGQMEALLITIPFVDLLERVARFCAQGCDLEMMEAVLAQLQRLSEPLVERGRGPAVDYLDDALGRMDFMAQEWFEHGKSQVEMARVEAAVAGVRARLAAIMR